MRKGQRAETILPVVVDVLRSVYGHEFAYEMVG
jgi:hypothetical protein